MGEPRRPGSQSPAGGRSTWEPSPALDPDPPAHLVPPAEVAGAEPVAASEPASVEPAPEATPSTVDAVVAAPAAIPAAVAEPIIAGRAAARSATVAPGFRIAFTPERLDLAGIGATVAGYARGEGEAVVAHIRALSGARSPADAIRLQVGEIQRAADASLTCWSTVARKVGRIFALR